MPPPRPANIICHIEPDFVTKQLVSRNLVKHSASRDRRDKSNFVSFRNLWKRKTKSGIERHEAAMVPSPIPYRHEACRLAAGNNEA